MNKADTKTVNFETHSQIGIININNPPVNALSQSVRQGLVEGIEFFEKDTSIKVIIIRCSDKTFIAGADISEFGKPPTEPFLPDVVNRIESSKKPVVASLFGTSLGGGFEVAMACHYRVALSNTKVGLPEVNLGLIPGAGGTQRLPRLVGTNKALEMITSGKHYTVTQFEQYDLFDAIFDSTRSNLELDKETISFVENLIATNQIKIDRVGERKINDDVADWDKAIIQIKRKAKGKDAPLVAANILHNTLQKNIAQGMSIERSEFLKLKDSEQSAALRYAFSVERKAAKTEFKAEPLSVNKIGVIGGGNMGSGIATAFLASGFEVQLIEQNQTALDAGFHRIQNSLLANVKRGRIDQQQCDACLSQLKTSVDYHSLADADLVIEAVFEDIQVKKDLFSQLDKICRDDCILATNTSYLDINEIASSISRPQQVVGMHFFSPANIMKLVEVVRAKKSSEQALVTAMNVAKQLKKIAVLVDVCFGFAGNRMYTRYGREVQQMLLEGAKIDQIDHAMTEWGMAMGPLAVQDLSGIDIGHNARSTQVFPKHDAGYFRAAAVMVENNRLGRKTSKGFYQYDENGKMSHDPQADHLINQKALSLGIKQIKFSNQEIVERALLALISEGLILCKEGIVQRMSDIDVIWLHGYGFPRHKGGPMFQAKQMGVDKVATSLNKMRQLAGDNIWPEVDITPLL